MSKLSDVHRDLGIVQRSRRNSSRFGLRSGPAASSRTDTEPMLSAVFWASCCVGRYHTWISRTCLSLYESNGRDRCWLVVNEGFISGPRRSQSFVGRGRRTPAAGFVRRETRAARRVFVPSARESKVTTSLSQGAATAVPCASPRSTCAVARGDALPPIAPCSHPHT